MTYLVAYDGSDLSETALDRAAEFADAMDRELVVATVVPENGDYARERDWIDDTEPFDVETVVERLRDRVESRAPGARFEFRTVGRNPQPGTIAARIRSTARDVGADTVFLGSENAGRVVVPLTSVAGAVASGEYDVYVVR